MGKPPHLSTPRLGDKEAILSGIATDLLEKKIPGYKCLAFFAGVELFRGISDGVIRPQCSHELGFDGFNPLVEIEIVGRVGIVHCLSLSIGVSGIHNDGLCKQNIDL
jgi:hypothetical protein